MHNPTDLSTIQQIYAQSNIYPQSNGFIHNPMDLHTFKHIKNGLKYMYLIIHNPMDLIENGLIHMYM